MTVLALLGGGGAGYAISEIEDTKDENQDRQRGRQLACGRTSRSSGSRSTQRLDRLEGRVDDTADAQTCSKLQDDVDALDKQVSSSTSRAAAVPTTSSSQLDDLEQRVEDLEQDSNND